MKKKISYKSYYQGRTVNILAYIFIFFPLFLCACMYVNVYMCVLKLDLIFLNKIGIIATYVL